MMTNECLNTDSVKIIMSRVLSSRSISVSLIRTDWRMHQILLVEVGQICAMHGASRLGAQTRQLGINWQTNYLSLPELYAAFENVAKSIFVNAARGSKEFHSKQWILSQSIDTQVRFESKPVWTSIQTLYSLISLATKDTCGVTLWKVFCVFPASSAAKDMYAW